MDKWLKHPAAWFNIKYLGNDGDSYYVLYVLLFKFIEQSYVCIIERESKSLLIHLHRSKMTDSLRYAYLCQFRSKWSRFKCSCSLTVLVHRSI